MFSKEFLNEETPYELNKIVEMEDKINKDHLIHKTGNREKDKTYAFQKFKTKCSFGRETYNNDLSSDDALKQQITLKNNTDIFKESKNQKNQ